MMKLVQKLLSYKETVSIVAVILLFTKILGFVKFRVIAAQFGASNELDLFWAAFLIPDFFFNILIAGSVNAAFIPIYSEVRNARGESKLLKLFIVSSFAISIISTILIGLLFIFTPLVASSMVDGGFWSILLGESRSFSQTDASSLIYLSLIHI